VLTVLLLYVVFTIIIGILAARFHRSVGGWIVLSLLISPLISGLILLASGPCKEESETFHSHGSLAGVPYRFQRDWSIDAMMLDGVVRFHTVGDFIAAIPNAGKAGEKLRLRVAIAKAKAKRDKNASKRELLFAVGIVGFVILLIVLANLG
jgi:hypothetical protein